jgi:lysophospholipase L1-like esterase
MLRARGMPPRSQRIGTRPRRRSRALGFLGFALACLAALALVEGASSLALLLRSLFGADAATLAERRHTRYDAELGWAHVPGLKLPDFYGPGRDLSIDARGFRGTREVSPRPAPGVLRVVCSGDSFTLGYGVGDDATWCARLGALSGVESVNLGQGGYGIGQSYLWYARDGVGLGAHVHFFAFISADFGRLLSDRFQGYAKPRLEVRDGALVTANVPVPRASYLVPWLVARREAFAELRSLQLLRPLLQRVRRTPPAPTENRDLPRLVSAVFAELRDLDARAGSRLVLVYLPMRPEHAGALDPRLPRLARRTARRLGIDFADLLSDFQRLPAAEAESLYLRPGDVAIAGGEDHFNERGNAWVARRLEEWIELPGPESVDAAP